MIGEQHMREILTAQYFITTTLMSSFLLKKQAMFVMIFINGEYKNEYHFTYLQFHKIFDII